MEIFCFVPWSLILREKRRLKGLESETLRRIFRMKESSCELNAYKPLQGWSKTLSCRYFKNIL
jgi:hypothetical protein